MGTPRVAVAASGGRDSTALLHCTARIAAQDGIEAVALHVQHGLVAAAPGWLRQLRGQCRRWGVALHSRHLAGRPAAGESVEAWARRERYRALAELARDAGCDIVLLAHHRRDQAETWLLQALRGGGPSGLAAMPRLAHRGGVVWARPWLDQPREAIEAYLRRHRLAYADDDSNADSRFARNRLRLQAWPALRRAFPDAEVTLARAAVRAQEAAALADEVAALDLPAATCGKALECARWLALPPARRRNVLRRWLAATLIQPVPESLVDRLAKELPQAASARWPAPGAELRLHRGRLSAEPVPAADAGVPPAPPPPALVLDLPCPGELALAGWAGRLVVSPVPAGGAEAGSLRGISVRARSGGESFRIAAGGAARALKKQFQARGVAAWEREGPLLYTARGELLFVSGLGIDAAHRAPPGATQFGIDWVPDPPPPAPGPRRPGR